MSVIMNIKQTTNPFFMIGNQGPTLRQGTTVPDNGLGADGDIYIKSDGKLYSKTNGIWCPLERLRPAVQLTDGSTIAIDLSVTNDFYVTLGGNRVLSNPTNMTVGQSGTITIIQGTPGNRLLSYGNYYSFPSYTAPVLSTAANEYDVIVYWVRSSTEIVCNILNNVGIIV